MNTKKIITTGLILAIIGFSISSFTNLKGDGVLSSDTINTHNSDCGQENNTYKNGEELTYKAYYNLSPMWVSAGEAKFKARDEGSSYFFSVDGRTYKSYEWFFKVRDRFESRVDKSTGLPTYALRDIKEGGYRLYDKLIFDQNAGKVTSYRGKEKAKAKLNKVYDLDRCTHDVLSIIYQVRNMDFDNMKPGTKFPVEIFLSKEKYSLQVRYIGKEKKKIKGLGEFNTIVLTPELIEGEVFKEKDAMKIWATDDANRVPLMISTPLSVGSVKVMLKSHKNLKYPLTSERD